MPLVDGALMAKLNTMTAAIDWSKRNAGMTVLRLPLGLGLMAETASPRAPGLPGARRGPLFRQWDGVGCGSAALGYHGSS